MTTMSKYKVIKSGFVYKLSNFMACLHNIIIEDAIIVKYTILSPRRNLSCH